MVFAAGTPTRAGRNVKALEPVKSNSEDWHIHDVTVPFHIEKYRHYSGINGPRPEGCHPAYENQSSRVTPLSHGHKGPSATHSLRTS